MANLVHRVGVVFHATDRISRHMAHIANKFDGLEKHQKDFMRGEAAIGRQQEKLAARQAQLNALMQRSAIADTRATAARIQMKKAEEASIARLDAAETAFQAKHEARMLRGEALDRAILERRTMLSRVEAEKQTAIENKFATARERATAASDGRLLAMTNNSKDIDRKRGAAILKAREADAHIARLAGVIQQRTLADPAAHPMLLTQQDAIRTKFGTHQENAVRASQDRIRAHQAQQEKARADLQHLSSTGVNKFGSDYEHHATQAHYNETLAKVRKLEALRESAMMGKDAIKAGLEAEFYDQSISKLRPELSAQKKALDDHKRVTELENKISTLGNKITGEGDTFDRVTANINAARDAALTAAAAKVATQSAKENTKDAREAAKWTQVRETALDDEVKHSHKLREIDGKIGEEAHKRAATLRKLREEEQASVTRMQDLERRRAAAQDASDRKKIESLVVEIQQEETKHKTIMDNLRAERLMQDRIDDERKQALGQELAARKAIKREREREFAIARAEENMMQRRQGVLAAQERSQRYRDSGGRALSIAGGSLLGGLVVGALVRGGIHGVAESQQHVTSSEQRLQALGVHGKTYDKVLDMSRQQSKSVKNTSFADSIDSFIFLHGLLGSPEAIMGKDLKSTRTLEFTNKFKAAAKLTFPNVKENDVHALMRAAETTSASNSPTGRKYSLEERQEHFMHRAELMFRALEITGGSLNSNQILSTVKQMQGSRFSLSDNGFLRTILYGNEVGGGKAGTAINSLLTNLGVGSQSMRKNAELERVGILDGKSKDVTRDKKGNIIGYLPTAIKNGDTLFKDPLKWAAVTLLPAINKDLGKLGKKVTVENQSAMLSAMVMKMTGRATSQGAVVEAIRQAERFDDAIKRAQEAENVQTRFAKATETYAAHVDQFTNETEKLNQALSKGVLPAATKFLQLITPIVTKMGEIAETQPELVGAATGAMMASGPALGIAAAGFGTLGIARLVMSWFAAPAVTAAASSGVASTFAASFAAPAVSAAAGSSLAGVFAGGAITRVVAPSVGGMMVSSIGLIPTVAIGAALTTLFAGAAYWAGGKAAEYFIGGRADGQADPALAAATAAAQAHRAQVAAGLIPPDAKQPWMKPGYKPPAKKFDYTQGSTGKPPSSVVDHSNPMPKGGGGGGGGSHTTHTSRLVVEFKGTVPAGVDTKKIEKGIVSAANTALPRLTPNTRAPNAHLW